MRRLLQMIALVLVTMVGAGATRAAAQEVGLYVSVEDAAVVWLKEEGRTWRAVRAGRWPVAARDSLWVSRGPVRLCVAGGRCEPKGAGKHRVEAAQPPGLLSSVAAQVGRFLGIMLPGPIRTTSPFAARTERHVPRSFFARTVPDAERDALPPALLLPGERGRVLPDSFHLVWLPAHPSQLAGRADAEVIRVRLYRTGAACEDGGLVLDTLARTNRLDLSGSPALLEAGATYRVELRWAEGADAADADTACFVAATDEEVAALQDRVEELAQALGMEEASPADWTDPDEALALVGLLAREGYTYDALLTLDRLMRREPDDWYLLLLWGQMLEATQRPEDG